MEPAGKGGVTAQLVKGQPDSTDDNGEDCPVCLTPFDDTLRRPRTLPCGHTFCTPCINGLKDQGAVMCPTCRVAHVVPEAGQFPVSYTIEAFIRRLTGAALTSLPSKPGKDTGEPAPSSVTGPGQKGPEGLSRPIRSMLQEQEAKVLVAIRTCQEVQTQLDQYQTTLAGWGERQQNLEDRLQALLDQSKDARVLLRQEESKLKAKKEKVQQGEQQLHALLQKLRSVATQQEVWEVVNEADHCTDEEGQRAEECQRLFPDVHTVTTINKVAEVSNAALEAATTVQAAQKTACDPASATSDTRFLTAEDSSITDKVEVLLSPTLKAEDLCSLKQTARRQLQAGPVFAIHQQKGRSRQARITLEGAPQTLQAEDLRSLNTTTRRELRAGHVFAIHQQEGRSRHARITLEGAPQTLQAEDLRSLNTTTRRELREQEGRSRHARITLERAPHNLQAEDLLSLNKTTRRELQAGRVFAIHQLEGRSRHARITLEDGRLYLHSLQDQPLLPRAVTVQMDEVVPAAPPCLVFLDLAWPDSSTRRVFIRLSPDTPLGRQFLLLCTGQRGPTYANTTLFKVCSDRWDGEWVKGGDYEHNSGWGGAALLPDLAVSEYRESGRAGTVWGWGDNPATGAQFCIITRKRKNWPFSGVFGDVVGGLEVVVAAAKHSPITEVTVVDCGVVLWE